MPSLGHGPSARRRAAPRFVTPARIQLPGSSAGPWLPGFQELISPDRQPLDLIPSSGTGANPAAVLPQTDKQGKKISTKGHEGNDCGMNAPQKPPSTITRGITPPLRGSRLGARASRPHPVPAKASSRASASGLSTLQAASSVRRLAAAELQCDSAGSHLVGGHRISQAEGE